MAIRVSGQWVRSKFTAEGPPHGDRLTALSRVPWEGGPSYYSAFSQATTSGMTSPNFFPILVDFEDCSDPAMIPVDKAYGVNGYYRLTSNSNMAAIRSNAMIAFPGPFAGTGGTETVGYNIDDEVDMWAGPGWDTWNGLYPGQGAGPNAGSGYDVMSQLTSATGPQGPAVADGRIKAMNYGKGVGMWESTAERDVFINGATNGSQTFSQDLLSCDLYFYSDQNLPAEAPNFLAIPSGEVRRAINYGIHTVGTIYDSQGAFGRRTPIYGFVEVCSQGSNVDPSLLTDDKIEGAVWACLLYEARGIIYFVHDFLWTGSYHVLRDNVGGHTPRVTDLNARITALAPVLNSQSYAHAWSPTVKTMTKQYNNVVYVFAMSVRQGTHNTGPRTFTLPAGMADSTFVEVLNENRAIEVIGGQFTDSFAAEYTCHIYKFV